VAAIDAAAVFGDSLVFPRVSAGQSVDDAWPQQLGAKRLWVRAQPAATSADALAQVQVLRRYVLPASFDVSVFQVGIVDATPRALPRPLQRGADRVSVLGDTVRRRHRGLVRLWGRPWTTPERFQVRMADAVERALRFSRRVVLVTVQQPGPALLAKVGPFDVEPYNDVLRGLTGPAVDVLDVQAELLPDGHHLSSAGHAAISAGIRRLADAAHPAP
jgi:hypothetical protein